MASCGVGFALGGVLLHRWERPLGARRAARPRGKRKAVNTYTIHDHLTSAVTHLCVRSRGCKGALEAFDLRHQKIQVCTEKFEEFDARTG